jgi:hypothetical protein
MIEEALVLILPHDSTSDSTSPMATSATWSLIFLSIHTSVALANTGLRNQTMHGVRLAADVGS